MKTFAAIQDGVVKDVTVTEGFNPPPRQGVPYVAVHWWVQTGDTTPDGGSTWFRDGAPQSEPQYRIPVGRIVRELTDSELGTWLALAFPGCNPTYAVALVRLLAQAELWSDDPRLAALRPGFAGLWGPERVLHLLRPEDA